MSPVTAVLLLLGQAAQPGGLESFDPSGLVRFTTPGEANDRRQRLLDFIWPDGLPTESLPAVTKNVGTQALFQGHLSGVDAALVASVDRLATDVSGFDFHSIVYLMHPATPGTRARLGVVHQGHQGALTDGIASTINHLLETGISVMALQMPLVGWNTDNDGIIGGTPFQFGARGTAGHTEMFAQLANTGPTLGGRMFTFFIEPVVQGINYFLARNPDPLGTILLGLSGGGWTAHLTAACDTRIEISIPVAGALPLYARPNFGRGLGDCEQTYAPLFGEMDSGDPDSIPDTATGVASWLEVFALGGYGPGRRQIQVLNLYDSCCFQGNGFETYDDFLSARVNSLGQGSWSFISDTSHSAHQISPWTISEVLEPALVPPEAGFRRGECNDDDEVDLSDAVCLLRWQFGGKSFPGCMAALNTNGDDVLDLSDAVYLLHFLFAGGLSPVEPFPICGPGTLPRDEALGCETTPSFCR